MPVKDAALAIQQMKNAELESTGTEEKPNLIKYRTEVPNCLSYALGLMLNAGVVDERLEAALQDVFSTQSQADLANDPDTGPPARLSDAARAAYAPPRAPERDGGTFSGEVKGLVTGDTSYPRTLAFLETAADTTLTQPSDEDWAIAYRNSPGVDKGAPPTAEQLSAFRSAAIDLFNAGLRHEASGRAITFGSGPAHPETDLRDNRVTLAGARGERDVGDLARRPATVEAPAALQRMAWQGPMPVFRGGAEGGQGAGPSTSTGAGPSRS